MESTKWCNFSYCYPPKPVELIVVIDDSYIRRMCLEHALYYVGPYGIEFRLKCIRSGKLIPIKRVRELIREFQK